LSRILITGGTGSLGRQFAKMNAYQDIIIYSRDEQKQWAMAQDYPDYTYFLGDVRDYDRLKRACKSVDILIHTAALKIVPKGETDPEEFIKTNVGGSQNVINAALEMGIQKVVFISTDKAVSPLNLYGTTKAAAERLFLAANSYSGTNGPFFSVVRYGNVMGSRGSVIPLFLRQAVKGCLTITDPTMTRFMFTLEEAVELIWESLKKPGLYIADCKSMTVKDIAKACWKFTHNNEKVIYEVTGIRPGEKIHEDLGGKTSDKADRKLVKELIKWISNYNQSVSQIIDFSMKC